jgi:hypothetical protein
LTWIMAHSITWLKDYVLSLVWPGSCLTQSFGFRHGVPPPGRHAPSTSILSLNTTFISRNTALFLLLPDQLDIDQKHNLGYISLSNVAMALTPTLCAHNSS